MRKYIIILFLLVCFIGSMKYANAYDYEQPLKPSFPYAAALYGAAGTYNIKPKYLFAIWAIESSGDRSGTVHIKENKNGTFDVGPFQINSIHISRTCKEHDIFTFKGNVYCAAKLIKLHSRFKNKDECWLARYHSKTPSKKKIYCKKIKKELNKRIN